MSYPVLLHFTVALHSQKPHVSQTEGKTLLQQKEEDSLPCGGLEKNPARL